MFLSRLSVRLVAADGLAAVEVAVDAGVHLVQHVGLVRPGGLGSWARAGTGVGGEGIVGAMSAVSTGGASRSGVSASGVSAVGTSQASSSGAVSVVSAVSAVSTSDVSGSSNVGRSMGGSDAGVTEAGSSSSRSVVTNADTAMRVGTMGGRNTGVTKAGRFSSRSVDTSGSSAMGDGTQVAAVITVRVDARVSLVGQVGVVGTVVARCMTSSAVVAGDGTTADHAGAGSGSVVSPNRAVGGVSASARTRAGGGVALRVHAQILAVVAVRVNAGVNLVGNVGAVRTIGLGGRTIDAAVVETSGADSVIVVAGEGGVVGAANAGAGGSSVVDTRLSSTGVMCGVGVGVVCGVVGVGFVLVRVQSLLDLVYDGRHGDVLMC